VVTDPRIQTEAPRWIAKYEERGTINTQDAIQDLEDRIKPTIIQGTQLFQMSIGWRTPEDTAGLGPPRDREVPRAGRRPGPRGTGRSSSTRSVGLINEQNAEIDELTLRRERIVRDEGIDSVDQRGDETTKELQNIVETIGALSLSITDTREQLERMEQMLRSDATIEYSDSQRVRVEQSPLVLNLISEIQNLRTEQGTMRREGIMPAHREYKQLQARIDAAESELVELRERELRKQFEGDIDAFRQALRSYAAQESDLIAQREEVSGRMNELTTIYDDLNKLDLRIERLTENRDRYRESLDNISNLAGVAGGGGRVVINQRPLVPDRISSPVHIVTVALGLILVTGLTSGVVVAREVLDQRIKGPSDVTMIPRTRVVGVIPLAGEDPSNPKHFETTFRDNPKGVLAENFRQVRTGILKQMERGGHKTLLVCSGLPRSGATGIVTNLAHAAAASEKRVLVIDANLRRPGIHKAFGLNEGPGLSDVLAGDADLRSASQDGGSKNLQVLTAGMVGTRVFERLGTAAMDALLAEASNEFDLVIVDTAPTVVSGDAMSLATRCDASMLVVRAMAEKRGMVNRIKNELADSRAELLGVLVNGVRAAAGGYMKRNIRATHEYQNEGEDGERASAA
jgi:capsular exopolysaccharide synthesis family protein